MTDKITWLLEREQFAQIQGCLNSFPAIWGLELVSCGNWGIEIRAAHTLTGPDAKCIAEALIVGSLWTDLSWTTPVSNVIRLLAC